MEKISFRKEILLSPVFIGSLFVLLLNDFYLKPVFDNWLTGKLSDFSGIILFTLSLQLVGISKRLVYPFVCIFFFWWKSAISSPFINWYNAIALLPIDRVIDVSDLWALALLIPLWFYSPSQVWKSYLLRRRVVFPLLGLSFFALTATSSSRHLVRMLSGFEGSHMLFPDVYVKPKIDKEDLFEMLKADGVNITSDSTIFKWGLDGSEGYKLEPFPLENDTLSMVRIGCWPYKGKSWIYLKEIRFDDSKVRFFHKETQHQRSNKEVLKEVTARLQGKK